MNWAGALFGASAALAVTGAAVAAFARRSRIAVGALVPTMLGVSGISLALGYDFLAIAVTAVLAAGVPAAALAALVATPSGDEARASRRELLMSTAVGLVTAGSGLWLLFNTEWLPAAGARNNEAVWLGWSLLSTDLAAFLMVACLLAAAGIGAVVLLRGRRAGRGPR